MLLYQVENLFKIFYRKGDIMSRLWVTGYRSYELGIFKDDEPKRKVIDSVLKSELTQAIVDGMDWLISGGQLGIEQWALEMGQNLKKIIQASFKRP